MKYDVVIIGGGVSGIVAALACIQYGLKTIIIEKNTRLGGRVHTIYQESSIYEAGAGRISSNHIRALSLLKSFGLTLYKAPSKIEYRQNGKLINNPTLRLLKQVIQYSKSIPYDVLINKTFGEVCIDILGSYKAKLLKNSFGYNAEFEVINAYDGIKMFEHDFEENDFYVCKEGLSEWISRMELAINESKIATINKGYTVNRWFRTKLGFGVITHDIEGNIQKIYGKVVLCTIPKDDLLQLPNWNQQQREMFNSVDSIPLHRIYGKFPLKNGHSWFSEIQKTTTNDKIRQFIPVSNSVAMMSYTDTDDAKYWYDYANKGDNVLRKALLTHMHVVFPDVPNIPKPSWINTHYWNAGVHMWKPGVNSNKMHKLIMHPYGIDVPFYIAGETYSLQQAWIEGALETVDEVLPHIVKNFKILEGGNSSDRFKQWLFSQNYRILSLELKSLSQRFPDVLWVTMRDPYNPKRTLLLDVTEWKNIHPGGSSMFLENKYTDITHLFSNRPEHHNPDGSYKKTVINVINNMINNFKVAEVV